MMSMLDLQARARRNAFGAMRELESRRREHDAVSRAVAASAMQAAAEAQHRQRSG